MKTVTKIVNIIKGGHNALNHRKFKLFLEEINAEYTDLVMFTEVRWLSRGNYKNIPSFVLPISPFFFIKLYI